MLLQVAQFGRAWCMLVLPHLDDHITPFHHTNSTPSDFGQHRVVASVAATTSCTPVACRCLDRPRFTKEGVETSWGKELVLAKKFAWNDSKGGGAGNWRKATHRRVGGNLIYATKQLVP